MLLSDLLYKVRIRSVEGSTATDVKGITPDSRAVEKDYLFIAIKGTLSDGHEFIENAVANGAKVIVCEKMPATRDSNVVYVETEDAQEATAHIAVNFFGDPSRSLKLVGVTGTNGKTTIATLLYRLFSGLGYKCGLLSTVENRVGEKIIEATHTTPDAISLNRLLKQMSDEGCTHCFMETSSHAIHQHRITGLTYEGGIFSNITHDHLDYHKTFDEYIRVKKKFFDQLGTGAFALTNADDKRGAVMLQNTIARKYSYSLRTLADFKGRIIENGLQGLQMTINEIEVHFRLIGEFNAYNLLAVYGAAVCLEEEKQEVLRVLSELTGAEGRFDYMVSENEKIVAIIDYAHTPDALLNVLATIGKLKKGFEQVITVVGCGGDRDKTKRPVMAEVACEHSDRIIFTSDNPRTEDPASIISDMEAGVPAAARRKCISIADRKEAIRTAISLAKKEDIILVAGKGHEKYQEINKVRKYFDDKEVVKEMFRLMER